MRFFLQFIEVFIDHPNFLNRTETSKLIDFMPYIRPAGHICLKSDQKQRDDL